MLRVTLCHLLPQAELLTFIARVNPSVKFTPVQLTAIVDEASAQLCPVLRLPHHVLSFGRAPLLRRPALSPALRRQQVWLEYAQHVGASGLSQEGLRAMYQAGQGEVDADFAALGLWINPQPSPPGSKAHSPQAAEGSPSAGAQAAAALAQADAEAARAWGGRIAEWASAVKAQSACGSPAADGTVSITTSPAGGQILSSSCDLCRSMPALFLHTTVRL